MATERSKKSILYYFIIPNFMVITGIITILYWPQNNMTKSTKVTINHGESFIYNIEKTFKKWSYYE